MRKPQKKTRQEEALSHFHQLFRQASAVAKANPALADRYVLMARRIAMRNRISMPRQFKRMICKHCYRFLQPGTTARVRVAKRRVIWYCRNCKKYSRLLFSARKSA
ncbi:ribonuclease P [Candidatus Woesearchaeota archaeon]|nr:ribonuclease P [Candidatus Woesearchaeota archaeon]